MVVRNVYAQSVISATLNQEPMTQNAYRNQVCTLRIYALCVIQGNVRIDQQEYIDKSVTPFPCAKLETSTLRNRTTYNLDKKISAWTRVG